MSTTIVVGSGIAGDEAARAARKLVRKNHRVLLITEEPHPLYSACVLADYVCDEIPLERVLLRRAEEHEKWGIDFMSGTTVTGVDTTARTLQVGDRELHYDQLILATGSRAVIPPLPGATLPQVVPLKTLADAEKLRNASGDTAVVVGSGLVGIEATMALCEMGWKVSIISRRGRVLPRMFDDPVAKLCMDELKTIGADVINGEQVQEILGDTHVTGLATDKRQIDAQLIVMVTGMSAESSLAAKAGLEVGPSGGIAVDNTMKTSVEGVWACGDCVETENLLTGKTALNMLWNNARQQGRVAGSNAAGVRRTFGGSLNVNTVSFGKACASSIGYLADDLSGDEVKLLHRQGHNGAFSLVLNEGRLVGVQAFGRTERVGSLMNTVLRGGDLSEILEGAKTAKRSYQRWHLGGLRRELAEHLRQDRIT